MMAECSALVPTMKPVTLCRKIMGVFLVVVNLAFLVLRKAYCSRLITKADELSALGRFIAVNHGDPIGDDAHLMSCQKC